MNEPKRPLLHCMLKTQVSPSAKQKGRADLDVTVSVHWVLRLDLWD